MARKPQPGSDNGTWGDILNEYLDVSHNNDGTLKDGIVLPRHLSANPPGNGHVLGYNGTGFAWSAPGSTVTHGSLVGLSSDDHPQYLTATRGDGRYYTQQQIDDMLSGRSEEDHEHDIANITGLQTALDGKAAVAHSHAAGDITGLAPVALSGSYSDLSDTPPRVLVLESADSVPANTPAGTIILRKSA